MTRKISPYNLELIHHSTSMKPNIVSIKLQPSTWIYLLSVDTLFGWRVWVSFFFLTATIRHHWSINKQFDWFVHWQLIMLMHFAFHTANLAWVCFPIDSPIFPFKKNLFLVSDNPQNMKLASQNLLDGDLWY